MSSSSPSARYQCDTSKTVLYKEPMGGEIVVMYLSMGVAALAVSLIILYSGFTHGYMNKLLADHAMAALTAERFFTLLKILLPIGVTAGLLALAIKIHHSCYGKSQLAHLI